jgi:hypothetical protein
MGNPAHLDLEDDPPALWRGIWRRMSAMMAGDDEISSDVHSDETLARGDDWKGARDDASDALDQREAMDGPGSHPRGHL